MVKLSDPITIRGIEFKNRIGYPPMLSFSSNRNAIWNFIRDCVSKRHISSIFMKFSYYNFEIINRHC